MRKTLPLLTLVLLAGCQTWGPTWSEVTGVRYYRTELNRMPAIIEKIDGSSAYPARRGEPIRVEPGRRVIELQGVPPSLGFRGTLQEFVLEAAPCKRYYVNAQFDNRLSPSKWAPVIDEVETIAGCTVVAAK